MALPAILLGGAALGAVAAVTKAVVSPDKTELKRDELTAESILVVRPKTALQRAATNLVQTLFF